VLRRASAKIRRKAEAEVKVIIKNREKIMGETRVVVLRQEIDLLVLAMNQSFILPNLVLIQRFLNTKHQNLKILIFPSIPNIPNIQKGLKRANLNKNLIRIHMTYAKSVHSQF
jgi:hypothetical protein